MVMNVVLVMVFGVVNDLLSWECWLFWMYCDLIIKNEYSEKKMGVGVYYIWISENSGVG